MESREREKFQSRGKELIKSLLEHLRSVIMGIPEGEKITVRELQELSGLTIKNNLKQEVWYLAFVTLLVELWKADFIESDAKSANTRDWTSESRIWRLD
jgi:hypothetical protein